MNKDLFLALLAMDSYDRGYGEAVRVNGCKIGESIFSIQSNITEDSDAVLAGFYASAYIVNGVEGIADGTVVISYRGTGTSTFWDGTWPDIVHGWPMGAGLQPDQADLALSFYEAVTRALVDAKRDQASDLTDRRRICYYQATAARRGHISIWRTNCRVSMYAWYATSAPLSVHRHASMSARFLMSRFRVSRRWPERLPL